MDNQEFGVVTLNGTRFPSSDYIAYNNTGSFEGKVVDGDYTRDSDKLMSAKIWTSFSGGIGEERHREGGDEGRVWFHTLNLDSPYFAALATRIDSYDEVKYPLGDTGNVFYAADDALEIWSWDETTAAWVDTGDALTQVPVKPGCDWNLKLYIPQGASGFASYDGSMVTEVAAEHVVDFVDWDDRLFAITLGGTLRYTSDGTTWATAAQLNTSVTPKSLVVHLDRNENEVIYLVSDRGLWAYNPTSEKFVRTQIRIPNHPDNGLGSDVWRPGEDLFFTAGLQVYRYSGGAVVPMGPDRNEGLPDDLRGRLVDLCSELNSLCGLLEGVTLTTPVVEEAEFDPGLAHEEALELSTTTTKSALLAWTGTGWHPRWLSTDDSGAPNWMALSGVQLAYRLWWGYGDSMYCLKLSRPFSNTAQILRTGEGHFEETGYADLGWVDHNMREFSKLASHIEINMENCTETEFVRVLYKTDFDDGWTYLGRTWPASDGRSRCKETIPFGVRTLPDGNVFSYGLAYNRIRFMLEFQRGSDDTQTPIMDSFAFKYIRLPLTGEVFSITVPLDFKGEWEGRTAPQIKVELDRLLDSDEFVLMHHGYDFDAVNHRVRLTRLGGNDRTGPVQMGGRGLTVIAVPVAGFNGNDVAAMAMP